MINIIPSHDRHSSDFGWLKTYWLFSFSSYYDPENIQFGPLRVFNDDIVEPWTGFPNHPHKEMEIITVVLSGEILHKDSMGNEEILKEGQVQRMSAGTGITHSEYNMSEKPVCFYQIWIYPDKTGIEPSYDRRDFSLEEWQNKFLPVASGQNIRDTVRFHSNSTIYRAEFEKGREASFKVDKCRRIFIYVTDGEIELNSIKMGKKDQARVDLEEVLNFKFHSKTELILVDLPSCQGWGYDGSVFSGK